MDLEEVQVATYLRHNPHFLEDWLTRNADSALLEAVRKKWSTSHSKLKNLHRCALNLLKVGSSKIFCLANLHVH